MPKIDEKIEGMYQEVLKRNPGETEFHQAVLEVLECLGPVVRQASRIPGAQDHRAHL